MAKDIKNTEDKRLYSIDLDISTDKGDLMSNILTELKKSQDAEAIKLGFDVDPTKSTSSYASIFRQKHNMIPNHLLKRIRDTEELIGGILLPTRARQMSLFGRPRANRFDVGFEVNIKPEADKHYKEEELEQLRADAVPKLKEILLNCGKNVGTLDRDKRTLSQFFMEIVEDVLTFGWFAVEIQKDHAGNFHSFRARDAGTIYYATPQRPGDHSTENVRRTAQQLLSQIEGCNIDIPKFENDEYTWVQVIDDTPKQVFTDEELIVWSLSPSTDISRNNYPMNPIERMISAITTHINLTTHNKMYFLNGRAAKNIMVFKSDNLDPRDLEAIKAQMVAHINSSNAAWRMPVFGMQANDTVEMMPLDASGRDMEFQYLADLNKRMIFAAYQMSPDEVAALSYLSKGTNSQSLSESNNEWKLIASRDTGLRPLMLSVEDFLNERLLPKINPEWAKIFRIDLSGLDADSPEKEATRLQQDSALFLTMNDIMERIEAEAMPIGGKFPLNAAFQQVLEKYFTKGQILKNFGGEGFENADKDPDLQYYMGDPVWLQLQQMKMQQQAQEQQMQAQQQAQQQQMQQQGQEQQDQAAQEPPEENLDNAIGQLGEALGKSEKELPVTRRELLKRHKAAKKKIVAEFEKESKNLVDSIINAVSGNDDHEGHNH